MNINSRLFSLSALAAASGTLVACGTTGPTSAQVVADIQGAISGLSNMLPTLLKADPKLISPSIAGSITSALSAASSALSGINPASPSASTLQTVETYLNDALDVLAALPVIPPPYNLVVQAAAVVAPELEAFVNGMLPPAAAKARPVSTKAKALGGGMSLDRARAILGTS